MELRISHCNNFFKIKGSLNKNNVDFFKSEFKNIFEKLNSLTISIEDLESMDHFGVNALAELHREAIVNNKNMAIIGLGSNDLYKHFKSEKAA